MPTATDPAATPKPKRRPGRTVTADEQALWEAAMRDAARLHPYASPAPALHPLPRVRQGYKMAPPLTPPTRLDLHGLSERHAHAALENFMTNAIAAGLRQVEVITGKGQGILQRGVPRWLAASPHAPHIQTLTPADRKRGGAGVLVVRFRKGS
jgi:DNA-nicking Smr family endonuclease